MPKRTETVSGAKAGILRPARGFSRRRALLARARGRPQGRDFPQHQVRAAGLCPSPRRTGGDRNPANAGAPQDVLDLQHKNHLPRASGGEPVEYSQLIAAGTTPRASGDPSYELARRGPLSNQTPQGRG